MNLVARAKAILTTPRTEWPVIDNEPLDLGSLLTGYVLPLAAIGPIATAIGWSMFGFGGLFRVSMGTAITQAIVAFIMAIVGMFVLAWIINALAPTFGGTQSMPQAIKLAAYSSTAAWVAGIFGLIPALTIIAAIGGLYSLYLCYLGLPVLMKNPEEKTMTYFIVIIVAAIILYVVIGAITSRVYM
ncbi:MAG TPA: Yip1 family protein [Gemmatimonadaceae bacterium]|nr:Yip1 family protein [Gemmatimonadaceae bacterium]